MNGSPPVCPSMQNRLASALQHRWAPLFLLGFVTLCAYGLVLARTGFYWDDLPMSWIRYQLGPDAMREYFSTNRPVWGWLYQLTTRLLPQVPVFWQVFALIWRWACAALVWGIGRELRPRKPFIALALGLLFLVYPGFNAQWTAYLYSHFFIVLAFYLFSLLCSLISLRSGSRLWPALGLLFSALNLWMMEYFFVLELTRGVVLWLALRNRQTLGASPLHNNETSPTSKTFETIETCKAVLKALWPYLLLFLLAVLSRLFIFNNQVYGFGLLPRLQADPAATLVGLLQNALTSLWTVSVLAWLQVLPGFSQYGPRTLALYGGVVLAVVLSVWAWMRSDRAASGLDRSAWRLVGLGLLMLPFASAPFWLIDLPVNLAFPANRFTLPSMFPVALVLGGLIDLLRPARLGWIVLALLVGLAAGRQFLWGTDFARDWAAQKNLFWQMTWRAPGLRPDTMVLLNEGALDFYADNSLSAALNWIYGPGIKADGSIPYLLFHPTNRLEGTLPELKPGHDVNYDYLAGRFTGSTSQVVSFFYLPPACLRVLDPVIDADNHFIPDRYLMREAAALSSSQWIEPGPGSHMPAVYGPEPAHGWCWYFEKADLARQQGDWAQVAALGDEAFASGDYPNDPSERFVFIEAYAHIGEWARAVNHSVDAHRVSPKYVDPMLCKLWARIEAQAPASPGRAEALAEVKTKLACIP